MSTYYLADYLPGGCMSWAALPTTPENLDEHAEPPVQDLAAIEETTPEPTPVAAIEETTPEPTVATPEKPRRARKNPADLFFAVDADVFNAVAGKLSIGVQN